MSKKFKFSRIFYFWKGIPKSDNQRTPIKGVPNTNIDFYEKRTGKFHRRRKINSKGLAFKDLDMPDINENIRHVHDYAENGKRSVMRNPTKKKEKWKKQVEKGDFGND